MKRQLILALILSLVAPLSFAGKVAIFSPEMAILASDAAKKAEDALKTNKEMAQLVAEDESIRVELEKMSKEGETKGLTWTAEERAEHRKKMKFLSEDRQLVRKKIKAQSDAATQKLFESMKPKVEQILKEIMAEETIDVVLRAEAAVYYKPENDITKKITEKLNKLK